MQNSKGCKMPLAIDGELSGSHAGRLRSGFGGFAHARAAAVRAAFLARWGKAAEPERSFIDLVDIPAGSFTMGSAETDAEQCDGENQVRVRIINLHPWSHRGRYGFRGVVRRPSRYSCR